LVGVAVARHLLDTQLLILMHSNGSEKEVDMENMLNEKGHKKGVGPG
jgi:hypothetical protein